MIVVDLTCKTVPVRIVPWPLILKQWSIAKSRGPVFLSGGWVIIAVISWTKDSIPSPTGVQNESCSYTKNRKPEVFEIGRIWHPLNVVSLSILDTFLIAFSIVFCAFSDGSKSILFRTTIILLTVISAITMHSAVWIWIPFVMSTTKMAASMMWDPPRTVLIKEAWPGQSTKVNCKVLQFPGLAKWTG